MSLEKQDLHKMIDTLNEKQANTVYDFVQYLIDRQIKDFWNQIDTSPADEEPLTDEERNKSRMAMISSHWKKQNVNSEYSIVMGKKPIKFLSKQHYTT